MYLLSQFWIYLLIAALLGALLAWLFGLCNCDKAGIQSELDGVRGERDDLAARLAAGAGGAAAGAAASNAAYDRKIAGLEAELAEARVKADELAAANAKTATAPATEPAGDSEDVAAMKWRNRYLEARVKFLEEQNAGAPIAAGLAGAAVGAAVAAPKVEKAEAVTNENFTPSKLAGFSSEELEKATLAAGAGKAPARSRKKSNPDDLMMIDGVGPKNNAWLNEQGIYYFHQIATMDVENVAWLASNLPTFGSRVYRENWVAQCTNLARGLPARG